MSNRLAVLALSIPVVFWGCVTAPTYKSHDPYSVVSVSSSFELPALTGLKKGEDPSEVDKPSKPKKPKKSKKTGDTKKPSEPKKPSDTKKPAPDQPEPKVVSPDTTTAASTYDGTAEIIKSATRLLGIVKSFDERSFLGHILIINDQLPKGQSSVSLGVIPYKQLVASKVMPSSSAKPGDIILFNCPGQCGLGSENGIAAGVVTEVSGNKIYFISYVKQEVRQCVYGAKTDKTALVIKGLDSVIRLW